MPTPASFDPSAYASATKEYTLGSRYSYLGREFRYFQNAADGALVDGDVVEQASATVHTVTYANGASATGRIPMGVACGGVPASYYFFALVDGIHTNVKSGTSTVGTLQKSVATNGTCSDNAGAGIMTFGTALTATSGGGRCTVMVRT